MILVDTSVWIDHFRAGDAILAELLQSGQVLIHPFVVGEVALETLRQRNQIISDLHDLPQAIQASDAEVLTFIDRNALAGVGIGYVDAHLLASTSLTYDARLWTRDRRLDEVSHRMALSAQIGSGGR